MNASMTMTNDTDSSPAEALLRAKEARRIQSAGRWYLLLLALGATYPIMGLAMLVGSDLAPLPPAASFLLMIGFVTAGMTVRKRIERAREKAVAHGVPNLSWPPLPSWITTVSIVATVVLFTVAGVLTWAGYSLDTDEVLPMAAFNLLLAAGFCWNAWRLRLWEYALVALSPALVLAMCLTEDHAQLDDAVLPPTVIALSIPLLIAGLFLRRRWRAFVAALPKEGDA